MLKKTHFNYISPDEYARRDKHPGIWTRDPLDYYIEQPWCSERLFEVEDFSSGVIDPACGSGIVVPSAQKAGIFAFGGDIKKRSDECHIVHDFLSNQWISIYQPINIVC